MSAGGIVSLVGAGPGDAGLLTVRGKELLERAEVVIYDGLVNRELLRFAPPTAEIIYGGKHDRTRCVSQAELNSLLLAKALEGKCVVRLKGGDPFVFGRGGEEAEALAAAGIAFEVVPGVSSVHSVACYAGIPLTHRDYASSVTVVTGHDAPSSPANKVDWPALARIPGTLVVLMGLRNIQAIAATLIAHGRPPETPVAITSRGTTGRQHTAVGTLDAVGELAAREGLEPPAITVIGEVVNLREQLNWFEQRPLFGRRVVVTRRSEQAGSFAQRLTELGADVLEVPTIKITQPKETDAIVDALLGLNAYDWLVFTSVNGVTAFFDIFFRRFQDLRDIGGVRIAAVGPATAAKLRELHLQVDLTPDEFVGKKIAAAFEKFQTIENLKMCLLRAEVANPDLPKALEELGAIVDDIAIYKTVAETKDPAGAGATLLESGADWITFTSGSTVEHFHARFDLPKLLKKFPQTKLASIGPETSKTIRSLGLEPALEAKAHTTEGLIAALLKAI